MQGLPALAHHWPVFLVLVGLAPDTRHSNVQQEQFSIIMFGQRRKWKTAGKPFALSGSTKSALLLPLDMGVGW